MKKTAFGRFFPEPPLQVHLIFAEQQNGQRKTNLGLGLGHDKLKDTPEPAREYPALAGKRGSHISTR